MNRAVFLDRDGTINVEKNYIWRCEDFEFLTGVPQALARLQRAGFLLIIVTNQSGIARGYYTQADVDRLHDYMKQQLAFFNVTLSGIYICPHHPDGADGNPYAMECSCRKGQPGMLLQAAEDLNVDLSRSYMVGDKLSDLEAGSRAGCSPLLVTSGHHVEPADVSDYCPAIFARLGDAVEYILQ
ncbi:MAG: D-glycero-beta-D-manno-heptose-1,7-bisphosphate 7-phosphatase [Candidatus Zixiibacteriota bacterium]|nr:MAG: D-glycero-beta-D-manno-heptose-1,7-bisphosphate 7-phosphatase [candidate division Zixibacteria bacterium]